MLVLTGKAGSGKTTVAKKLEEQYQFQRIVTYTTRPPRKHEPSVDYHFISEDQFRLLESQGFFAETSSGAHGMYGSALQSYKKDRGVIALDMNGVVNLRKKAANTDIVVIYLEVPEEILKSRLKERGDPPEEVRQRMDHDRAAFRNVGKYVDIIFEIDEEDTVDEIAEAINEVLNKGVIH